MHCIVDNLERRVAELTEHKKAMAKGTLEFCQSRMEEDTTDLYKAIPQASAAYHYHATTSSIRNKSDT